MRTHTLSTTKILAVALTTLAGCAATPAARDPGAEEIRAEAPTVATTPAPAPTATAAPEPMAAPAPTAAQAPFSPPCDDDGYPLVGNAMPKGPSRPPSVLRVAARSPRVVRVAARPPCVVRVAARDRGRP